MKKLLLAGLFSLLAFPSLTMAQVTQVADVDTEDQSSCITISNNLRYRMRDASVNNEVSDLQDFLNMKGYLSSGPTGYFGMGTFNAVKKFQKASGFAPTGYVGPLTRAKINASCGGNMATTPVATQTSIPTAQTTVETSVPTITITPAQATTTATTQSLPYGCTSTIGFSSTTGSRCFVPTTVTPVKTNFPAGCVSSTGFSQTTGQSCGVTATQNSAPTVDLKIVTQGLSSKDVFINASIVGNPQNKNVSYWVLSIGCSAGITMPGKGAGQELCGTTIRMDRYNMYDPTQDYLLLTAGATNKTTTSANITLALVAYDQNGNNIGGDKEGVVLTGSSVATTTQTTTPTVEFIGTPTLTLQYDSAQKESALVANYGVSITAPTGSSFKLYKYGAFDNDTDAFMVALSNPKNANGAQTNGSYYKVSGNADDNGNYWMIPVGQTAAFNLTANLSNPRTLFAGSYNATLSLYKPAGGAGIAVSGKSTTNSVTIIGETSPYIIGAYDNRGLMADTYMIEGDRFDSVLNKVTINGVTKTLASNGNKQGGIIYFKLSDFGITTSGAYSLQVSTSEGASNFVNVNVTMSGDTIVSPKVSAISIVGAQTSYPAGSLIKFSVKAVATDGSSANPSRNFNVQSSMRMLDPIQTYLPVYVNGVAQSFNATYNQSTGYWDVVMTAPSDSTKTYDVDTAAYCANSAQGCQSGQLNKGFRFNVTASSNLPDLTIGKIVAGVVENGQFTMRQIKNGERYVLQTTVQNIGDTSVNSFQIYWDIQNSNSGSREYNLTLSPGQSQTVLLPFAEGEGIVTGNYFGKITVDFQNIIKESKEDNNWMTVSFDVVTATTPSITVLSPNGGEALQEGTQHTIRWSGANIPSNAIITINVFNGTTGSFSDPNTQIATNLSSGTTSYTWKVASNTGGWGFGMKTTAQKFAELLGIDTAYAATDQYKIGISAYLNGEVAYDVSDAPFSIVASSTVATSRSTQTQTASVLDAFSPAPAPVVASAPTPTWAYSWTRNLEVNSPYKDDVTALQTALAKEDVYTGEVTGGFYTQTYLAVKAFQAKYGIESTGFVGPITLAKLNDLY